KLSGHVQKLPHLPVPFPVSKKQTCQQKQRPHHQNQQYRRDGNITNKQKHSESHHANQVSQQEWNSIFPILSTVHIVYPCRCFVLMKSVRPMPASFSRIRLMLTLSALSST